MLNPKGWFHGYKVDIWLWRHSLLECSVCVVAGGWPVLAIVGAPPVQHHTNTSTDARMQVVVESHLSWVSWLGIIAHKRIISGQDFTQCSVCMFCYTPGVCADTLECSRTWRRSSAINIHVVEMLRMKDGRMLIIYNTFLSITLSSKCMSLPLSLSVKVEIKTRIE